MSRLLPFKSEPTQKPDGARVLPLEDEATDEALAALSSETARNVLSLVYEEPMTPPEIRDEIDTSLQNVHYHLENLEDADLIQPAGSGYSEKGTEMTVYAPASEAVVLFAGHERDRSRLQTALTRLLGAVGLLALASFVVRRLGRTTGTGTVGLSSQGAGGDGGGGGAADGANASGDAGRYERAEGESGDGGDAGGDGGFGAGDGGGGDAATAAGDATPTPDGADDEVGVFGGETGTSGGDGGATPSPSPEAVDAATETAAGATPSPAATGTPAPTAAPTAEPTATAAPTATPSSTSTDPTTATTATETASVPPASQTPEPGGAPVDTATPTDVAVAAGDPGSGLLADPAVTFFLGGLFMLGVVGAWWYVAR